MRILVVEDEKNLAAALCQILKEEKYQVEAVHDGLAGYDYVMAQEYDAVILDAMLPKMSGFEVLKKLREQKNATPIIMLTAKDEIEAKIKGLDFGADDYMTKPFVPEELLARLRAVSRRKGEVVLNELVFGDVCLNTATYEVAAGIKSVRLGYKEFEVLRLLMANGGHILTKEQLLTRIWGDESDALDNNVEVYISFLRKKLSYIEAGIQITTIRKVGYKLEEKVA